MMKANECISQDVMIKAKIMRILVQTAHGIMLMTHVRILESAEGQRMRQPKCGDKTYKDGDISPSNALLFNSFFYSASCFFLFVFDFSDL